MGAEPLSRNDIEAEISYAYLHAVASSAGVACESCGRVQDNAGVDAMLTGWGPFPNGGLHNEVDIKVQLKATIAEPRDDGNHLSYFLRGISRYDDLRSEAGWTPRILVVLFLPNDPVEWLTISDQQLVLKKSAYWVSLRGAMPTTNDSGQTIYLPRRQLFTPDALVELMARLSRRDLPVYEAP